MAKKIDKDLFDRMVNRQIAVGRYAERQAYEIIKLLNRADKELLAKIMDRGESDSFTGRRLEALLKETRSIVDKSYRELFDATKAEMEQFAPHAAEFAADTLSMSLPAAWSPVSISDEQLVAIVDKTPISIGKDKKLLLEEVFSSMASGKEEMIRGALRLGMVQGETVDQMVRRLKGTRAAQYQDGLLEGSRRSMANMVRSVVQHTNNVAVQSTYAKNSDVLNGWLYIATLDSRTCPVCFSQSGKEFPLGEGPLPIRHVSCLPGDSLVTPVGKVLAVSKRWFDGDMVVFKTASGKTFSSTPNHPVLTPGGWVAAGLLNVGGHVIRHNGVEFASFIIDGNDKNVPSRIEDIAEAFLNRREVMSEPVKTTTKDFHGDGSGSKIAIIGADRELRFSGYPPIGKHSHKVKFISRDDFASGPCPIQKLSVRSLPSLVEFMGSTGESFSLFWRSVLHSSQLLLASVSKRYAVFHEKLLKIRAGALTKLLCDTAYADPSVINLNGPGHVNNRCRVAIESGPDDVIGNFQADSFLIYPIFGSEVVNACAEGVLTDNGVIVDKPAFWKGKESSFFEPGRYYENADAVLACNLLDGGAGQVFVDEIVDIEISTFSGHVYNLQTESNCYISDGIVTHNCRCFQAPAIKSWSDLGFDLPEFGKFDRAAKGGPVDADISFNDWLKDQDSKTQVELLGPARARLFADGKMHLDKFTDSSGSLYTLAELKARM